MNKIIQINLSGRLIMIEEKAYEDLQSYLNRLRDFFSKEEDCAEIMNDIEGRMAELFQEKLKKGLGHISESELDEIIQSIGKPEDLADNHHGENTLKSSPQNNTHKRLYRDENDKVLGGVCSGIASYLGMSALVVRLLFAIITFGGFGTGFIIYLALWILLPKKTLEPKNSIRLFRNPDDRVLGGVASGLAAYFQTSANTLRLIFALPLFLNLIFVFFGNLDGLIILNIGLGSLTGICTFAYLILWILLPEAKTPYQKIEMRGEHIDINRIRQQAKESTEKLEHKMKDWGKGVEGVAHDFTKRTKDFSKRSAGGCLYNVGKLIRVCIYLLLGIILFPLLISGIAVFFAGIVTWPMQQFFWTNTLQQTGFWIAVFLFFYVPVFFLFIWIIRRLAGAQKRNKSLSWSFGILWTLGWISFIWIAIDIAKEFQYKQSEEIEIPISDSLANQLTIDQTEPSYHYSKTWTWFEADDAPFDITQDALKLPAVALQINKSNDSGYHVSFTKFAYGVSEAQANKRIDHYVYNATVTNQLLDLGPGIEINKADKYRGQHVVISVSVPVGKSILFTKNYLQKEHWIGVHETNVVYDTTEDNHNIKFTTEYAKANEIIENTAYRMGVDGNLYTDKGEKLHY